MKLVIVRHGHTKANQPTAIVSDPIAGARREFGLTSLGPRQAADVVPTLRALGHVPAPPDPPSNYAIYASPFSRARETAEEIARCLDMDPDSVILDDALRERYFGEALEGGSSDAYTSVWAQDAVDVTVGPVPDGESVMDVAMRCQAFVDGVRQKESADVVFLVSHGDTLSILATHVGKRGDLAHHRQQGLDNCGFLVL